MFAVWGAVDTLRSVRAPSRRARRRALCRRREISSCRGSGFRARSLGNPRRKAPVACPTGRYEPLQTMQTLPTHPRTALHPWLERYPSEGGSPDLIPLETLPFTIGRNEEVDLQIDSGRVSREHATIVREGGRFRIEDLGSTNGTFVNGRRVDKATLQDGDLVLIADVEFAFFSGQVAAARRTVTEVIATPESVRVDHDDGPADLILAVRRAQEVLTHRSVFNRFQPIVAIDDRAVAAYEAIGETDDSAACASEAGRALLSVECRLTERMRYVERLLAVEEAATLPGRAALLVKLHATEIAGGAVHEWLARLHDVLPDRHRLVVEVPDAAFDDSPDFREFHLWLREVGIGLACGGFAAGQTRLQELEEVRPDFLKLAPPLARRIHANRERQRRLKSLIRASREFGCRVVGTGIEEEEEAATCRELGCELGQGSLFGAPLPVGTLRPGDESGGEREDEASISKPSGVLA